MIALAYILLISLSVLGAIRCLLPEHLKPLLGRREFAAAALLPAIATFSPSYPLFALLVLAFMALTPATPEQRFRLLLFCLPLLPVFSLVIKAPAPINQFIRVDTQVIMCVGCIIAAAALGRRSPAKFRLWDALLLLLLALIVFIDGRGTSGTNILRETLQALFEVGVPYYVVSRSICSAKRPAELMLAFVFAAAVIGAIATFESLRGWLLYSGMNVGQDPAVISGYTKQRGGFLRAHATFPEPTSLSVFLALALVICFAARREIATRSARLCLYAIIGLGIFFTFARVGPLMLAIGIFAVFLFERRHALAVALLASVPLIWGAFQAIGSISSTAAGILGMGTDASGTVEYRRMLSERIFPIILKYPLFGVDTKQVPVLLEDLRQGEGIIDLVNAPLVIAMQSGLIGLLIFILPTLAVCRATFVGRRRFQPGWRSTAGAVFAGLFALNIGLVTTSLGVRNLLWLLLLLGAGAGVIANHRIRHAGAKPTLFGRVDRPDRVSAKKVTTNAC